jgi:hypothetical protein
MAVVLAVQALLFQDGGITAYGANLLAMGAAGALGGYAVSALVARLRPGVRGLVAGPGDRRLCGDTHRRGVHRAGARRVGPLPAGGGAAAALVAARADRARRSRAHGAILATLARWRPDLLHGLQGSRSGRAPAWGLLVLALALAAFAAPFASGLPDGSRVRPSASGSRRPRTRSGPRSPWRRRAGSRSAVREVPSRASSAPSPRRHSPGRSRAGWVRPARPEPHR